MHKEGTPVTQDGPTPRDRLGAVTARIREAEREAGRPEGSVVLVAASKAQPAAALHNLAEAGQRRFGENFLQEALAKMDALPDPDLEWHFIGRIQSNKTREIAARFHWVHGVDRLRIARRLHEQRPAGLPPLSVCIEVNFAGETAKGGVDEDGLPALAREIAGLDRLRLRGLMSVPPPSDDVSEQRLAFARVRQAAERLAAAGLPLDTLSMGMSGDLEAAIAEGATMVRVGTALFGPRPARPSG
jgi:PLP dependent protein